MKMSLPEIYLETLLEPLPGKWKGKNVGLPEWEDEL